ncbi:HAD family hydrolase [Bacillus sp. T33-2]|uniref:HAD family hydrolase n=1 Tax=Bacillus sp. T33-2 TaxID=2054168 RepID=UPI0015E123B0|nr:HAD family hydrolase [Bacillus sp. T33-2]
MGRLDSNDQLDEQLPGIIKDLQDRGIVFVLTTGRSVVGAKLYGERLGISHYVSYNGGYVLSDGEVIHDVKVPGNLAEMLCLHTNELGGTFIHYAYHTSRSNQPPIPLPMEYLLPEAEKSTGEDIRKDVHRVVLYLEEEDRSRLKPEVIGPACFDEGDRLEVFPEGSKWTGILPLIKKLGFSPDETVAIGNGMNDMEMITEAGFGIAMKNSPAPLLEKADWVTEDLDHNGVTVALQKVFQMEMEKQTSLIVS